MSAFRQALLEHSPKIPGLEERILISPRRLHLTLGVMNLTESVDPDAKREPGSSSSRLVQDDKTDTPAATDVHTVQSAIDFLHRLKPRITEELGGGNLRVGLKLMDIMRPDKGDLTQAHIMWTGPSYEDEHAKRLKRVCGACCASGLCPACADGYTEFVHKEFKNAGLVVDDRRPLKARNHNVFRAHAMLTALFMCHLAALHGYQYVTSQRPSHTIFICRCHCIPGIPVDRASYCHGRTSDNG